MTSESTDKRDAVSLSREREFEARDYVSRAQAEHARYTKGQPLPPHSKPALVRDLLGEIDRLRRWVGRLACHDGGRRH